MYVEGFFFPGFCEKIIVTKRFRGPNTLRIPVLERFWKTRRNLKSLEILSIDVWKAHALIVLVFSIVVKQ